MAIPPRKADSATATQAEITDLLQILVFRKTITRDQAERVRRYARANSMPVMQTIVQLGIASEIQITEALAAFAGLRRSEEHTSELQSHSDLVCRLLLEKKKKR